MRILVDENLPITFFAELLKEHDLKAIKDLGWCGLKNGELMKRIEGGFELFITADKNIRYQQNLTNRTFAILEVFTNRLPLLKLHKEDLRQEVHLIQRGEYKRFGPEHGSGHQRQESLPGSSGPAAPRLEGMEL